MVKWKKETIERIKDKRRRNRFLENLIRLGLRHQLRALRSENNNMTQGELAKLVGTTQSVISRLENDPSRVSLPTLLSIADALDVGVIVRFESIDKIINWYEDLTRSKIVPKSTSNVIKDLEKAETTVDSTEAIEIIDVENTPFVQELYAVASGEDLPDGRNLYKPSAPTLPTRAYFSMIDNVIQTNSSNN